MTATDLKKSRRMLLIVAVCFLAPLAMAFVLYYGNLWRPANSTQKGELIHPARPLPNVALTLVDGMQKNSADLLQEKWSLVYIGDGQCDARCRIALADIRQTRLLLADKMDRVQRIFFATEHCCDIEFVKQSQGLIIAHFPTGAFAAAFPAYASIPVAAAGRIYLIDPLGNLMMSYAADAPSMGMLTDLKKLLRLSHIG